MPQFRLYFNTLENMRTGEMRENIITTLAGARYDEDGLNKIFSDLEIK